MKTPTIIVVMTMLGYTVLTALNWSAVASPTTLSLGFTSVHAPLGLVLLTGSALLTATFLVFVVFQQTTSLVEARRFARDLRAERDVAEKTEASRLTDLRTYLEAELRTLADGSAAARADTQARLDRLEEVLMTRLAEVGNGLAAHVSEVEDKLDRAATPNAH